MNEKFIDAMNRASNVTRTENGAGALKSTLNRCLDAFGSLGGMRNSSDDEIIRTFSYAFGEDRETAMRMLFYMRDIRGGQGARRVFQVITKWLASRYPDIVIANLDNFMEFGYAKDLWVLLDTKVGENVARYAYGKITEDVENMVENKPISLMGKWLPSANSDCFDTRHKALYLIEQWGANARDYRKIKSALGNYLNVVETYMASNRWDEIDFSRVPSYASLRYTKAFNRHTENYRQYLRDLAIGKAKANASALYPVDILDKLGYFSASSWKLRRRIDEDNEILCNAMWESLPNYFEGRTETGLCVVDTSGSMQSGTPSPLRVAVSLGLYCADKCRGPFHNKMIIFSEKPVWCDLPNAGSLTDKLRAVPEINPANTNLEAVFDMILNTAITSHCTQEDLPNKLYIISDMQFDAARGAIRWCSRPVSTFMESMKNKYSSYGYTMPMLVYWNVRASNNGMFQTTFEGENVAMVSGYSASLFKSVIDGTTVEQYFDETTRTVVTKTSLDPMDVMYNTLYAERYNCVKF